MKNFSWNSNCKTSNVKAIEKAKNFIARHGIEDFENTEDLHIINDLACHLSFITYNTGNKYTENLFWRIMSKHYGTKVNGCSFIDGGVVGWWSK